MADRRTPVSRPTLSAILATLSAALGLATSVAVAQPSGSRPVPMPSSGQPPRPGVPPATAARPTAVELAGEPFRIDSVGLSVRLPVSATAQSAKVGTQTNAQVLPQDQTWLINIQTPQTSNPATTITAAVDETMALMRASYGVLNKDQTHVVSTQTVVLDRTPNLVINGQPAERIYFAVPGPATSDNPTPPRLIKAYTIFKPASHQFVVFELITQEPELARVRPIYETAVATATFVDPAQLQLARAAAIRAGVALFASLPTAEYDRFFDGQERWYRLSKPAPTGSPTDADELGYRGVRMWKGKRGEVDPERPSTRWTRTEQQDGYLVRIRVRLLDSGDMVDSTGTYFMSPDRREEAWLIRMTRRDSRGRSLGSWNEVGARDGSDLTVLVEGAGQTGRTIRPLIQGEGYLSQVDSYVLPGLLAWSGLETELGFYTYRSLSENVSFRRDTVGRSGDARMITTEFREDAEPQQSLMKPDGELIRSDLGDGRVWRPIELQQLSDLWARKKLPMAPLR